MKEPFVRPFLTQDIDLAYEMDAAEKWDHTRKDIERIFSYEPSGCFVAEVNGRSVGHVSSISYGRLGWIGMLIVKPEYRRRGIGTLLTKRALAYLSERKVRTTKLEAVPEIAGLYRKLGFREEFRSLRFVRHCEQAISIPNGRVEPLNEREIKMLAEFDAGYFGVNRYLVLNELHRCNPHLCFVSHKKSKITGYIMCCKSKSGYRIGPWVCESKDQEIAKRLLARVIMEIGHTVKSYVGALAINTTATTILQSLRFRQYSSSIRMRMGKKLGTECVSGILAIGGPEKG